MAGLAVLRRASRLSDAYRPRWQGKVFEQAVLGKTPSLFRALPHLVLAAGGNQRAVMLLYIPQFL
jgi:hypothetical protein